MRDVFFVAGLNGGYARFITALLRQHSPGDPRQLVGESRSQNVRPERGRPIPFAAVPNCQTNV